MVPRRPLLIAAGAGVLGSLAGCLGDDGDGDGDDGDDHDHDDDGDDNDDGDGTIDSVADAEPLGQPVDPSGVSWDDLGDLEGTITS